VAPIHFHIEQCSVNFIQNFYFQSKESQMGLELEIMMTVFKFRFSFKALNHTNEVTVHTI